MDSADDPPKGGGCPIRRSSDQSLLAAPQGFSQRATSFIASWRQGIHQMPLLSSTPTSGNRTRSFRRCTAPARRRPRPDCQGQFQRQLPQKPGRSRLPAGGRAPSIPMPMTPLPADGTSRAKTSTCRCPPRMAARGNHFPHAPRTGTSSPPHDVQTTRPAARPAIAGERQSSWWAWADLNQLSYRPQGHSSQPTKSQPKQAALSGTLAEGCRARGRADGDGRFPHSRPIKARCLGSAPRAVLTNLLERR